MTDPPSSNTNVSRSPKALTPRCSTGLGCAESRSNTGSFQRVRLPTTVCSSPMSCVSRGILLPARSFIRGSKWLCSSMTNPTSECPRNVGARATPVLMNRAQGPVQKGWAINHLSFISLIPGVAVGASPEQAGGLDGTVIPLDHLRRGEPLVVGPAGVGHRLEAEDGIAAFESPEHVLGVAVVHGRGLFGAGAAAPDGPYGQVGDQRGQQLAAVGHVGALQAAQVVT